MLSTNPRAIAATSLALALALAPGCRTSETAAHDAGSGEQDSGGPVAAAEVPEPTPEFEVIRLEYAVASELAAVLEDLVRDASAPPVPEVKILADARTNSLLVMADPDQMPQLKELIVRLDVEQTAGG